MIKNLFVKFNSARRSFSLYGIALVLAVAVAALPLHAQQEQPPEGPPPDGAPPGPPPDGATGGPGGPGGPGGHGGQSHYTFKGVYTAGSGESKSQNGEKYSAAAKDLSAVYAHDGGSITLEQPTIESSGNTSSQNNSRFFGLNAAVLAAKGGVISIHGGTITTSGEGANGAFASGTGSSVTLSDLSIVATGGGGHGVMAAGGGTIMLSNVNIDTKSEHGAALATDRGGGRVTATGGTILTAGQGSPAIYSTGVIKVTDATMRSTGAEGAVIEGSNSVVIEESSLEAGKLCGAMLYQSFSGDANGRQSHLTLKGGSFAIAEGPAFYVTNTHGTITLSGVKITTASGVLVKAAPGRWGRKGQNGGSAKLIATTQTLFGDLVVADATSAIDARLRQSSSLAGAIRGASLTLDSTSQWSVTADSQLAGLTLEDGETGLARIHANGHTVTYNASDAHNSWLAGKSYPLAGDGQLQPATENAAE